MEDHPPQTQLLAALWDGDMATALSLVKAGADINIADVREIGQACTPLHFAVGWGDQNLVRALIAAGAKLNAQTVAGQTPLWWACNNDYLEIAKDLLSAGADPNIRSTEGYSPLGRVRRSHIEFKELLRSYAGVL